MFLIKLIIVFLLSLTLVLMLKFFLYTFLVDQTRGNKMSVKTSITNNDADLKFDRNISDLIYVFGNIQSKDGSYPK